ncbi:MAG: hypothetical protein AB1758_30105 [Candidatus Eremiobacterota bacterium]
MTEGEPVRRWREFVEWQNWTFSLYLRAQLAQGRTREEALQRLARVWAREDAERLEAIRRIGQATQRAG